MSAAEARVLASATSSISISPSSSARRPTSASALRVGKPGRTSTCVRIAVMPLASISSACVCARATIDSGVIVGT